MERCRKKSALQQEQIADCAQMDTWRLYGELLTANLHQLQGGLPAARVTNYYDPECGTLEIPMDVQLTPSENAQRYYKKYNKGPRLGNKVIEAKHVAKAFGDKLLFDDLNFK